MSEIEQFAFSILEETELRLAHHLHTLLSDDKWDAGPLLEEILPVYWEMEGDRPRNIDPTNIYRPLNYIRVWSSNGDFKNSTRAYMDVISAHLEGCLHNLLVPRDSMSRPTPRAFGQLVVYLKQHGTISLDIASRMFTFNEIINVRAKHFSAYTRTRWLDERTFTPLETTCVIMLMRKLSIQLFPILEKNGVVLKQGWPEFRNEWLSRFDEYKNQRATH